MKSIPGLATHWTDTLAAGAFAVSLCTSSHAQLIDAELVKKMVALDLAVEGCGERLVIDGRKFNLLQAQWRMEVAHEGASALKRYKSNYDTAMIEVLRVMRSNPTKTCNHLVDTVGEIAKDANPISALRAARNVDTKQ